MLFFVVVVLCVNWFQLFRVVLLLFLLAVSLTIVVVLIRFKKKMFLFFVCLVVVVAVIHSRPSSTRFRVTLSTGGDACPAAAEASGHGTRRRSGRRALPSRRAAGVTAGGEGAAATTGTR